MAVEILSKSVDPQIISALEATLLYQYGIPVSPETVTRWKFDAPIYDRLRSLGPDVVEPSKAATFSILTSADFTGSGAGAAFAAGGDPYSINPQRSMTSLTKKSYGASGGVKDIDIIASGQPGAPISLNTERFANDAEMLLSLLYMRTIQGIDYDMIQGTLAGDANAFDGLEISVTAANSGFYIDRAGATLTAGMINQHVSFMMAGGAAGKGHGPIPTAIYCHPTTHKAIVDAYEDRTKASINITDGQSGNALGLWATNIVTPAGLLPIISDPRFTISSDGTNITGDIFFAVENHNGVRLLYPEWQIMPTAINLSKVMGRGRATSTELAIWSHLVLVERTNWWAQGRVANVAFTFDQTVASATE